MTEAHLVDKMVEILRTEGYDVYREVPFWLRRIDIYAERPGAPPFAIEVKLRDWRTALSQAKLYQLGVQYVYVAMPGRIAGRVAQAEFRAARIGLMGVDDRIEEILPALRSGRYRRAYRDMMGLPDIQSKPQGGDDDRKYS